MARAQSLHGKTRRALAALELRPRRSLGQNFLVSPQVVSRIVQAADVAGRTVVEIGPGLGAMSEALAAVASKLVLVEVDGRMAGRLRERFATATHVEVVEADATRVDYARLLDGSAPAVVVANLPYSVGSQILLRLLEFRASFDRLVLMLQREVAERLAAKPATKAYGLLTVWTTLYGVPRILFRVPPGAFEPRPRVDSAVVWIALQPEPRAAIDDERWFREVVRAAFAQRRKMLRAALAKLGPPEAIARAGIAPERRGETLSLDEFAALARSLARRSAEGG
jgi:16S rRNA (adenine1518-N6/adenine1519-N6)-dimethyltransferase